MRSTQRKCRLLCWPVSLKEWRLSTFSLLNAVQKSTLYQVSVTILYWTKHKLCNIFRGLLFVSWTKEKKAYLRYVESRIEITANILPRVVTLGEIKLAQCTVSLRFIYTEPKPWLCSLIFVFVRYEYVSLRLRVQNRRKKWNFPLNFRTLRKLSDLYSGIFQNYWLFNHLDVHLVWTTSETLQN